VLKVIKDIKAFRVFRELLVSKVRKAFKVLWVLKVRRVFKELRVA
jgi:hypothetical protein